MKLSARNVSRWMITDRQLVGGSLERLEICMNRMHPKKDYVILRELDLDEQVLSSLLRKVEQPVILNWNGLVNPLNLNIRGLHLSHARAKDILKKKTCHEQYETLKKQCPNSIIGTSVHSLEEWLLVAPLKPNYVLVSNIFNTSCKIGKEGLGILESTKIAMKIKNQSKQTRVIALGGVYPEHEDVLASCGFDGIAMRSHYHEDIF